MLRRDTRVCLALRRTRGRDVDIETLLNENSNEIKRAGNEINATNLQQTGFCNKSNRYNTTASCVNDRFTKHVFRQYPTILLISLNIEVASC